MFRFYLSRIAVGGPTHLLDYNGDAPQCGADAALAPLVMAGRFKLTDADEMLRTVTCKRCRQSVTYRLHERVRTPEQYAAGLAAGAYLIPSDAFEGRRRARVARSRPDRAFYLASARAARAREIYVGTRREAIDAYRLLGADSRVHWRPSSAGLVS